MFDKRSSFENLQSVVNKVNRTIGPIRKLHSLLPGTAYNHLPQTFLSTLF